MATMNKLRLRVDDATLARIDATRARIYPGDTRYGHITRLLVRAGLDALDAVANVAPVDVLDAPSVVADAQLDDLARVLRAGLDSTPDLGEYRKIGCYDDEAARALADLGVTPEAAATQIDLYGDTGSLGYHVANGTISPEEAAAKCEDADAADAQLDE